MCVNVAPVKSVHAVTGRLFAGVPLTSVHEVHWPLWFCSHFQWTRRRLPTVVFLVSVISEPHSWHLLKSSMILGSFTIHLFVFQSISRSSSSVLGAEVDVELSGWKLMSFWSDGGSVDSMLMSSSTCSSDCSSVRSGWVYQGGCEITMITVGLHYKWILISNRCGRKKIIHLSRFFLKIDCLPQNLFVFHYVMRWLGEVSALWFQQRVKCSDRPILIFYNRYQLFVCLCTR